MTLIIFAYLQLMDFLTTVGTIAMGGAEGNPFAAAAMDILGVWPATGLLKLLSLAAAWFCLKVGLRRPVVWANWLYSVIIPWNVLMMISAGVR
jgi:hypothetical protein